MTTPGLEGPHRTLAEITQAFRDDRDRLASERFVLQNKNYWDEHDKRKLKWLDTEISSLDRRIAIGEGVT